MKPCARNQDQYRRGPDIEALRLGTKADIEALRLGTKADMAEVKSDLLKWMMGALIAQGGVVVALLKLLQG